LNAQIFNPVEWSFSQNKISENEIELTFKAKIDSGWYVYSQYAGEGPVSTEFTFSESESFILKDNVKEGEAITEFDPNFDVVLSYFKKEAVFTQLVQISSEENFLINGDVYFMTCDAGQCLPPEAVEFSFEVEGAEQSSSYSIWRLFFIAFLSGFAALLTPCVFPMIPMTVSFFTKQSKTKSKGIFNAIIYGISIIVIYVALGVGVSSIFGADALNNMATNVYFNIGFFLLLIIFGASFLGAFEIQLPSSWVNSTDKASDRGGLIGIFFMAFTLALVSFSCTGPIVGTLLVEAASGGYMGQLLECLVFH
jgi:thiol:disulfide interchange protein DsbD